ncbi:MAG: tyrosine--tRNA ligase, partial [Lachnospiraceae bacterium]|nr:tyrosine--tRNA ligase [Lachnospiraceae bacterium]
RIDILGIMVAAGMVNSRSDARRAVDQGGVTVKGGKISDVKASYTKEDIAAEEFIVKKGKKSFKKILV